MRIKRHINVKTNKLISNDISLFSFTKLKLEAEVSKLITPIKTKPAWFTYLDVDDLLILVTDNGILKITIKKDK